MFSVEKFAENGIIILEKSTSNTFFEEQSPAERSHRFTGAKTENRRAKTAKLSSASREDGGFLFTKKRQQGRKNTHGRPQNVCKNNY